LPDAALVVGKNKKQPRVRGSTKPSARKKPAIALTTPPRGISWRFAKFDHDGPWPLHGIEPEQHRQLLEKLGQFEKAKFADLSGERGAKFISVDSLDGLAQQRLEALELDDSPGLWELHLGGKPRLWGTREGEVMILLWWDPEHEVCPSRKRNT
jgi:hypothetical protein